MTIEELCCLHYEVMVLNHWPVCFGKKPLLWDIYNIPGLNWIMDRLMNRKYRKVLEIIRDRIGWLSACQWEYREIHEFDSAETESEMLKDLTDAEHRQPYSQQMPRMIFWGTRR